MIAEWSPDHKELVFTSLDPLKGRGAQPATFKGDPEAESADLSPDGTRIAVGNRHQGKIYVLSLSGEVLQQFTVENWNAGLDWAADGKGIFVSTDRPEGSALLHVDLGGKARVMWEQRASHGILGIPSPDGRKLAISGLTGSGNYWMLQNF